jgi:hypothetical protein
MSKDQHMLAELDYIDRNITQNINLYDIARESGFTCPILPAVQAVDRRYGWGVSIEAKNVKSSFRTRK